MSWRKSRTASFFCLFTLLISRDAHPDDSGLPTSEQTSVADRAITESALSGHIRFLADDLLEGRGPGSRGDKLAQAYIISQFETLRLQPAAPGGGWLQPVPLTGVTTQVPPTIVLRHGANELRLEKLTDYVLASGRPIQQARLDDAEMVFVGYGIIAPEFDWDDYKGADLKGKVLVCMNNDPATDPALFAGKKRLYYGRWDYKYETAARLGAAGAIIIHTTESAGYPYQVVRTSWSGEEFELRDTPGPRLQVRGWLSEDAARRLATLSGHDLDQLRAAAERRDFRPVPLGTRVSVEMTCDVRQQETANVLGILPGCDPVLGKDLVIFMAHHDHLGIAEKRNEQGDQIYNGAGDNASGVAALLSIASGFSQCQERPKRSILFAAVGAEEQGLLGSKYFADHPPGAAGRLAAVINIDGINHMGPTHDVNVIGLGKSNLDAIVERIATWQKRQVTADQFPDRGYYYRSDQFSLAKIGVPGVYLHSGVHVIGKPEGWGKQVLEEWIETKYHQPSDEFDDTWDLRGAVADTQLLFHTGWRIAQQPAMPNWIPGDEFETARKTAIEQRE